MSQMRSRVRPNQWRKIDRIEQMGTGGHERMLIPLSVCFHLSLFTSLLHHVVPSDLIPF